METIYENKWCRIVSKGTIYVLQSKKGKYNDQYFTTSDAALQAVASEFQQKYTVRQDPQLVENQRAVAASRNQMATTTKEDANAEWAGMTSQERQAKVRQLINRG